MKLVVQNGSQNPLSRADAEAVLENIPPGLLKGIESVLLCRSESGNCAVQIIHYPKERLLSVCATQPNPGTAEKIAVIEELVVCLALIREYGKLPTKLSANLIQQFREANEPTITKCKSAIV